MKLHFKKVAGVIVTCSMIMSSIVSAKSTSVTYKFVDSNSYTYITSVTKSSTTDYASAKISKFYKADGTPTSDYDELYVQCGSDGTQASSVLCKKGTAKKLTLKGTYNQKGKSLSFYAMGHDPSLDCYIDGTFDADAN